MAFANASNCRLSHLRRITDGDGGNTSGNTAQTKLRADCANSSSDTNVKMWGSFYPGTRSLSHSLSYTGDDTTWVLPHNTATTMFGLPGGLGTYIVSIGFDGIGNTAAYSSCGIVHGDGTSYKLTVLTTSTAMTLSINGSDIKGTQGSGSTLNISWSMIRIQ